MQHRLYVLQDLIVGEANDGKTAILEFCLPLSILLDLLVVHWTVNFDDQVRLRTIEVDQEAVYGVLPSKPCTVHLTIAYRLPETSLSPSWGRTKLPRGFT
jgi:hypothetical protein